jgi:hypothetical protein
MFAVNSLLPRGGIPSTNPMQGSRLADEHPAKVRKYEGYSQNRQFKEFSSEAWGFERARRVRRASLIATSSSLNRVSIGGRGLEWKMRM